MRRIAAIAFSSVLVAAASARDGIVLKADSNITIVEQGNYENAQGWLSELLGKYLKLVLKRDALDGPGAPVTFILEARAPEWHQIPREFMRQVSDIDAFDIEAAPGTNPVIRITGNTVTATGFGVMHFLENCAGVTWMFPGDLGTCLPKTSAITVPAMKLHVAPQAVSRLFTGFVYHDPGIPVNRIKYEGLLHRQSVFFYSYDYFKAARPDFLASPSHNMIGIFPPELQKTVPEIFPMQDGKRWFPPDKAADTTGRWQAWHPCYTSPKSVEIAVQKAREAFAKHEYCFSLGINDGLRVQCQCDECRKVGWPQSYYQFVTTVADRVKDCYPPQLIGLIAYGDVATPPPGLKLPENVLVMVAGGTERLNRWTPVARHLGIYEYASGWGYWIPNVAFKAVESNARFYRTAGIRFYRSEMHPFWAFDAPRLYMQERLLWDPDLEVDDLLRRFCEAGYGPAAKPMRRFYRHWADRWSGKVNPEGLTLQDPGPWPHELWRNPLRQFRQCRAEDFAVSRRLLEQAAAAAPRGAMADRVEMVSGFLEDSATLFAMYALVGEMTEARPQGSPSERLSEAQRLLARRIAGLEKMKAHPEWFTGASQTVGADLKPSWEDLWYMPVPLALENGMRGELLRLNQAPPPPQVPEKLRVCLLPGKTEPMKAVFSARPWYYPWAFVPMDGAEEGEAVKFKIAGRTEQRITERQEFSTRRKLHGLEVASRLTPIADNYLYVVELDAAGRQGFLSADVSFGSHNRARTESFLQKDFGKAAEGLSKRFVFPPTFLDTHTLLAAPLPPGENNGVILIHLLWDPATDDAPLEGTCSIKRVTLQKP